MRKLTEQQTVALAIIVIIMIVSASFAFVYAGRISSLLPPITDQDGDGVPDSFDPAPSDPAIWTRGIGILNLTIQNNYSHTVQFFAYLTWWGDDESHPGNFWAPNIPSDTRSFCATEISWLIGKNYTNETIYIEAIATVTNHLTSNRLYVSNVVIQNNEILPLSVLFPEDFGFA